MKYLLIFCLFIVGCAKSNSGTPECSYVGTHVLLWKRLMEGPLQVYQCNGYVLFNSDVFGTYKDVDNKTWPIDCSGFIVEKRCEI